MDFCSLQSVPQAVVYMYSTHPLATAPLSLQIYKAYIREA